MLGLNAGIVEASARLSIKGFMTGLDTIHKEGGKVASEFGKRFEKAGEGLARAGASLSRNLTAPIVAAGAAMFAASVQAGNFADEIDKMSIRSGLSRTRLQELRFVTDQVGVEFSSLERSIDSFRRRLPQVEAGTGRVSDNLRQLGISTRDAEGNMRSMDDMFPDVLRSLAQVENETERGALAVDILGRSASSLAPLMAQGEAGIEKLTARAHELGLVMGDEAITEMVAFHDAMAEVRQQVGALSRGIGMSIVPIIKNDLIPLIQDTLVPAISGWIDRWNSLDDSTKKSIITWSAVVAVIGPAVGGLGWAIKLTIPLVRSLTGAIAGLTKVMIANPYLAVGAAIAGIAGWIYRAERNARNFRTELEQIMGMSVDGTEQELIRVSQAIQGINERIEQAKELHKSMDSEGSQAAQNQLQALKDQRSALIEVLNKIGQKRNESLDGAVDITQANKDIQDSYENIIPAIERVRVSAEKIKDEIVDPIALAELRIMREEYQRFGEAIYETMNFQLQLGDAMEEGGEKIEEAAQSGQRFGETIGNALSQAVLHGRNLSDIADNLIKQFASRAFVTGIAALATGGSSLAGGSFLGSVFGGVFHSGGKVPGSGNKHIIAQGGEYVMTPGQMASLAGMGSQTGKREMTINVKGSLRGSDRELVALIDERIRLNGREF